MTKGYLLDTNIVSEAVKPRPPSALVEWLGAQPDEALHISALTVAEIRRGILEKAPGRRRRDLEAWFAGPEGPQALFAGRVLPFDARCAGVGAPDGGRDRLRPAAQRAGHGGRGNRSRARPHGCHRQRAALSRYGAGLDQPGHTLDGWLANV